MYTQRERDIEMCIDVFLYIFLRIPTYFIPCGQLDAADMIPKRRNAFQSA